MEVRMSLAEAAAHFNTAPNTIRSRFKAGKIRGERDNTGKIWVWVDPENSGSKNKPSKPSKRGSKEASIETLISQIESANAELTVLRPKAALADQLAAENALLVGQIEDLKSDRDAWRDMASRRSWFGLFRR